MTLWLLQLAIIVVACGCFGALAERVGQSRVVGEIVAGIVLGPSIVGAITPGFYGAVFGPAASTGISQLGEVGVVMLMFDVGLHMELGSSTSGGKSLRPALLVAFCGMALPFVLGLGAALWSWPALAAGYRKLEYVLFCGVALSVSAVPVMGKMVIDMKLTRHPAAKLALGAAMLTDLAGWLALGVIASLSVAGSSATLFVAVLGELIGFGIASLLLVRLVVRPLARRAASPGERLAILVPYVLGSAWATAALGFHSVFGALFAAILLRDLPNLREDWDSHFGGFVRTVLLPVFFAYAGLHAKLNVLASSAAWFWFAVFFSVAFVGKFGGAFLGARAGGVNPRHAAIVGSLMNTRGLMELVVLAMGLQMGVLPGNVYAILVTMALVTTAMTIPFVRWFGGPAMRQEAEQPARDGDAPAALRGFEPHGETMR
ncbi:cation:proton antiporter [Burkholderia gladioli]|uniref:Sodium:proton antiporter n=1 Tax=Burkholderia gladioli TaxID=28095 RepID=A0A2A7SJE5_BURGA|nr:cation:proton antiporter [Burkholderia gladioli]ATF88619.1 sodium:proton antiporter [Burkholderia gladioli pv. gladioli]MBJ9664215.1 cation:proton antiporter [Burkholderia gladioli]MBU9159732.1 cation:proton antiporter [Burkholderia gladioli]MBU9424020.1 cation:proton antiporter [Burkholderia gladioli]MCH7274208.1 cation:proton antiporter [Burkholderia gladioli]